MKLHLVDGTFELFRAYFAMPPFTTPRGRPANAVGGLVRTLLALLRQDDVTHVAVAFDHVVESFRNDLFQGYKTGEGVPEDLFSQFDLAERAASSLGLVVWPMVEFEADDALAAAAFRWSGAREVDQVVICSPDKDLTQMVRHRRVVCLDRRRKLTLDQAAVEAKFGVSPGSIPDYLALVGDPADGIPGVPRWGVKATAEVLRVYGHVEKIPEDPSTWPPGVRGARALAGSLAEHRDEAALYKELATLRIDVPLPEALEDLEWRGVPRPRFQDLCAELGMEGLMRLPRRWASA